MPSPDDASLLRDYCATRSEPAFTQLVQRHLPLVYDSALRRLALPPDSSAMHRPKLYDRLDETLNALPELDLAPSGKGTVPGAALSPMPAGESMSASPL